MKLLCAGDSLTRAQISADYVEAVGKRIAGKVVRAGVNLELSSGLVARLDALVAHEADAIAVASWHRGQGCA